MESEVLGVLEGDASSVAEAEDEGVAELETAAELLAVCEGVGNT